MLSKKLLLVLPILVVLLLFSFALAGLFPNPFLQHKPAALQITSEPETMVFLNSRQVGKTPYQTQDLKEGEYEIKLAADSLSWQSKVKLSGGTLTVVNRVLSQNELQGMGEILTLEKGEGLAVVSLPTGAKIKLDGEEKNETPQVFKNVSSGDHEARLSVSGYLERMVRFKITSGYKLTVLVQLARGEEKPAVAEASAEKPKEPQVVISQTPTGWLRVRDKAGLGGREMAKVDVGEAYPLLSEEPGWVKIRLKDNLEGWVSAQYVQKQ